MHRERGCPGSMVKSQGNSNDVALLDFVSKEPLRVSEERTSGTSEWLLRRRWREITTTATTATVAARLVVAAGYDGMQLDWEGLQMESKTGLESFVAFCRAALRQAAISAGRSNMPHLSVTVYMPKLVSRDATTYNVSKLAQLADSVFVMGYDLQPLGVPMGQE